MAFTAALPIYEIMLSTLKPVPALALSICAALAAPAVAGGTAGDVVRIEVLDGGMTSRGTYVTALRLTLADGWKTYWRAPGDAGIPPLFDWRASRNVGSVVISWPTPQVFDQNGMQSIGYKHELVLPVEITPANNGQAVRLTGQVDLGLCKDVCIPETLSFDHELDANAPRNPAIVAALAQRPHTEAEAGVRNATCRLSPTAGGLRIEAQITMPSAGGPEVAVIEPGNPRVWASETVTTRDGNLLIAASELAHVDKGAYALDRSKVRITVLGQKHAVDIRGCKPG